SNSYRSAPGWVGVFQSAVASSRYTINAGGWLVTTVMAVGSSRPAPQALAMDASTPTTTRTFILDPFDKSVPHVCAFHRFIPPPRTCLRSGRARACQRNARQQLAGTRLDRCAIQARALAIFRHHGSLATRS